MKFTSKLRWLKYKKSTEVALTKSACAVTCQDDRYAMVLQQWVEDDKLTNPQKGFWLDVYIVGEFDGT